MLNWKEKEFNYHGFNAKLGVDFYSCSDFMGMDKKVPAICLSNEEEEYIFSKSFGEFIGEVCTTYIDTNNYPDIEEYLVKNKIAFKHPAGFTKHSGFCEYPLYIVNPEVIKELATNWRDYFMCYDFLGIDEDTVDIAVDDLIKNWNNAYRINFPELS